MHLPTTISSPAWSTKCEADATGGMIVHSETGTAHELFDGRTLTVARNRGDELGQDGGQIVHPTEVFLTVAGHDEPLILRSTSNAHELGRALLAMTD